MIFDNRQQAQAEVFFLSTGAAALSALGHPGVADRFQPATRANAGDIESHSWPASVKAGSIWSLALWMTVACALVMAATSVVSSVVEPPASLADVAVIDAEQGRKLMDAGAAMIDTRSAAHYARERIEGALNVAYEDQSANEVSFDHTKDRFDLAKLPADKTAPLVFYCNARVCWTSYKASKVAAAAGYSQVNWLRGGLTEWMADGHPIATHGARPGRAR